MKIIKRKIIICLSIGWLLILSACSSQSNTMESHQLANITEITERVRYLKPEWLSPNAEYYIDILFHESGEICYQVISTKDISVTIDQNDYLGFGYTGPFPWAPDSSAFVAIGSESPGIFNANEILIITSTDYGLSTVIFSLPISEWLSVDWFSDNEHLMIQQANTYYIINKEGQLEWEYYYEKPDDVVFLQMIDNHIIFHRDTQGGTEITISTINLSSLEISETTYEFSDVQFMYVESYRYETEFAIFFEEGENRVWLYDTINNTLTQTGITVPGDVYRVDIIGEEDKISALFEEGDGLYLNIYNLATEELINSINTDTYVGWYPDLGGFLIWTGTSEDGKYEIVN